MPLFSVSEVELPDLVNKNIEYPVKYECQINYE